MKQGAGEGSEIEDLLTFPKGFDVDSAKGNGASAIFLPEGGDDFSEVVTGADQDGDASRLDAAGRRRL